MSRPGFQLGRTRGGLGAADPFDHLPDDQFSWSPPGSRAPDAFSRNHACEYADSRRFMTWLAARRERAQRLRRRICEVAFEEWLWWWTEDAVEHKLPGRDRVKKYYDAAGMSYTEAKLKDVAWRNANPWSAAFITWVMKEAGAGADFASSPRHVGYFFAGKAARTHEYGSLFKTYRASEVTPQRGDLILNPRAGSGITFDNLKPWGKSHSDVVFQRHGRELTLIGGNISRSRTDHGKGLAVASRTVTLDANMRLEDQKLTYQDMTSSTSTTRYVAILRIEAQTGDTLDLSSLPRGFNRKKAYKKYRRFAE